MPSCLSPQMSVYDRSRESFYCFHQVLCPRLRHCWCCWLLLPGVCCLLIVGECCRILRLPRSCHQREAHFLRLEWNENILDKRVTVLKVLIVFILWNWANVCTKRQWACPPHENTCSTIQRGIFGSLSNPREFRINCSLSELTAT